MGKDYRREVLCYGKYEGVSTPMAIAVSGSVEITGAAGCMSPIQTGADDELYGDNISNTIAVT